MKDNSLDIKIGKKTIHTSGQLTIDFKSKLLQIRDTTKMGSGDYILYKISDSEFDGMMSNFFDRMTF